MNSGLDNNNTREKSEYELLRERNIRERDAFLATCEDEEETANAREAIRDLSIALRPSPRQQRSSTIRRSRGLSDFVVEPRRSLRLANISPLYYGDEIEETQTSQSVPRARTSTNQHRRSSKLAPIIHPDSITQQQLKNIAKFSSRKTYNAILGTTCHQCRQKTLDTKTVCRSGICTGIRGQFCGPCLRGRYAEDVATALMNPNWVCPCCLNLCNCSYCRTHAGLRPTGILAPIAVSQGYLSVKHLLEDIEGPRNCESQENDILGFNYNGEYAEEGYLEERLENENEAPLFGFDANGIFIFNV